MKMISLFAITVCLLISCTGLIKSNNVKDFIPGIYISRWKTEFSESIDTLLIEPLMKKGSDTYSITRRTHTSFFKGGRKHAPEYKIKHWTGFYDSSHKTLVMENDGSVLSFDPVTKEMKRGITAYTKL